MAETNTSIFIRSEYLLNIISTRTHILDLYPHINVQSRLFKASYTAGGQMRICGCCTHAERLNLNSQQIIHSGCETWQGRPSVTPDWGDALIMSLSSDTCHNAGTPLSSTLISIHGDVWWLSPLHSVLSFFTTSSHYTDTLKGPVFYPFFFPGSSGAATYDNYSKNIYRKALCLQPPAKTLGVSFWMKLMLCWSFGQKRAETTPGWGSCHSPGRD